MTAKVTINLQQMSLKRATYVWNRLTPTTGAKSVTRFLSTLSADRDITVSIDLNGLYSKADGGSQKFFVLDSASYARTLGNAGVTELIIPKGSSSKGVKYVLDSLSDHLIGESSDRLVALGFHIQLEGNMRRLT